MPIALIYVRFSPRPKHADGESLELQLERATRYCHLSSLEWAEDRVFEDPAVSAGKPFAKRPGGAALLAAAKKLGQVHIVAKAVDRMFRNVIDGIVTEQKLRKRGIKLHFVDQGGCTIDCSTAWGRRMFISALNDATFEREQTGERTREAMLRYQREGRRMSAKVPYGKMVDPADSSRLIDNQGEMGMVRIILEMYQEATHSATSIASYLNMITSKCRSKKWNPKKVASIIKRYGEARA